MSFNLTRKQTLALARDRHLSVTANAGSGKTSVLVDKYIDLLMNSKRHKSERIRSIIAITFTRQAAAEMKVKITRQVSKMMLEPSKTPSERARIKNLRENISSARVSTIHSFCNSLLRDYPLEAGISPVFRELDEYESNILLRFSVDYVIGKYSSLLTNHKSEYEYEPNDQISVDQFGQLVDIIGISNLIDNLLNLVKEPIRLSNLSKFYSHSTAELREIYHQEFENNFFRLVRQIVDVLIDGIDIIPKDIKKYDQAISLIDEIQSQAVQFDVSQINNIIYLFNELRTIKVNRTLLINYLANHYYSNSDEFNKFKADYDFIQKNIQSILKSNIYTDEYIDFAKSFVKLASEIHEKFQSEKEDISAYSFDDLLILANDLLSDDIVRDRIIKDYDYLLVDEFQDTNHIQYEIVKKLVPSLINPEVEISPKVFIVGDAKQSIYGFRSADVSVFNLAGNDIQSSNQWMIDKHKIGKNIYALGKQYEADHKESVGQIALADTFRLLPAIALFVNHVCENLFKIVSNDINYENLICGRQTDYELFEGNNLTWQNGTIKFLFSEKNGKGKSSDHQTEEEQTYDSLPESISSNNLTEEELLAKYILNIINGQTDIRILKNGEYVNPNFGDIAILTRKKTSITKLVRQFIIKKIPFIVSSGKGFYQTPEVNDFISLLGFLVNQSDDIKFLSALKSPLFCFDDSDLIELSTFEGSDMYHKFQIFRPEKERTAQLYDRASYIISELLNLSNRLTVTELLIRIIEITDYYAVIQKFDAAAQIKSNIKQLIKSATNFESQGYKNLYDFLIRINSLSDNSGESEADFVTGENLVNLMTIHASKGLEFPIVVLFGSNTSTGKNDGIKISKNFGLSLPFKIKGNSESRSKSSLIECNTIPASIIKSRIAEDDLAEEARLLYVAMTRAKDHLIVSAGLTQTKDGYSSKSNSFIGLILQGLSCDTNEIANLQNYEFNDLLKTTSGLVIKLSLKAQIIKQDYFEDTEMVLDNVNLPVISPTNNIRKIYSNVPIIPGEKFDIVSATKFSMYVNDPKNFVDRYILGLPDLNRFVFMNSDNDESDKIDSTAIQNTTKSEFTDGAIAGTLIHATLERINQWIEPATENNYNLLITTITNILQEYKINDQSIHNRVFTECRNVVNSEILRQYSKHLQHSEFEKTLNLPFGGSFLNGNIDLLIKDKSEEIIEVWDWKSNQVNNREEFINLGIYYKPQIHFYLFLISKLYPGRDSYIGKLLFTRLADTNDWTIDIILTNEEMVGYETELLESVKKMKSI